MSIKRNSKLSPTIIVEDHCDALPFILRAIGSKQLSFDNNIVIHFDSHPDLLLDLDLKSDDVFEKDVLLEKISIETWMLPLAFAGHFSTFVWIAPQWSHQIPEGCHSFHIGRHKESGKVQVSSPLLYFISALIYSPLEDLEEIKLVNLHVISFEVLCSNLSKKEFLINLIGQHSKYLLDIDLDFFSTLNPFISLYEKVNAYQRLQELYKFELDSSGKEADLEALARRTIQLESLRTVLSEVESIKTPKEITSKIDTLVKKLNCKKHQLLLKQIVLDLLTEYGQDIDWMMVHDAGTTIDDSTRKLPHHPSNLEEIDSYIKMFRDLVASLPLSNMVTLARSSEDEYCPPTHVDYIQEEICKFLRLHYDVNIYYYYKEET